MTPIIDAEMILANMSPEDILRVIPAELLQKLPIAALGSDSSIPVAPIALAAESPRPHKRPVNAFMAFRSRYFKLFPKMTQKDASTLVTMLWAKDPWKHRWALVAKVYSFARDEMTPTKLNLAKFLDFACSAMALPEPALYLKTLGWTMYHDEEGMLTGTQSPDHLNWGLAQLSRLTSVPNTELELLTTCVSGGFAGREGARLITKMGSKDRMIMAVDFEGHSTPQQAEIEALEKKLAFYTSLRDDPTDVAANLLGLGRDDITAGVIYADDVTNTLNFGLRQEHIATMHIPSMTQAQHSLAMYEIVENSLSPRHGFLIPQPAIPDGIGFPTACDNLAEFPHPNQVGVDNPLFFHELLQACEKKAEQRRQDSSLP